MTDESPSWTPDAATVSRANLTSLMRDGGFSHYEDLHRWSTLDPAGFWGVILERLGVVFRVPPDAILAGDALTPRWLPGARLNIVDSCFTADPEALAVVSRRGGRVERVTYGELLRLVDRFANGYSAAGLGAGERVAIAMPMSLEAVVAYLGTIAAGGVVVSIADSFAPHEIGTRLRLTGASTVVTQDRMRRAGKELAMYGKVVEAGAASCIVVETEPGTELRNGDVAWDDFLGSERSFEPVPADPQTHTNILFSSGTTGDPKVIPWTQLTPIKAAMDACLHQDIRSGDVVAWPTNLGWMMGPWLIYAALINDAAIALYDDAPGDRGFTQFVADAGVTMLGTVPSIVAAWRATDALDDVEWATVRVLSSTGEASNPDDYRWLMETTTAPVIEYCGGTEIGGGYLTGTVVQPALAAAFSTPALGLDVCILDDEGNAATTGELFLVPPSIGLSQELLNRDHDAVYYAGTPEVSMPLRRHGDQVQRLANGYYRAMGRVDDTMNLGGVKVSSAEIERLVAGVPGVAEAAAVAVAPPGGGPGRLVVFVVPIDGHEVDIARWKESMQHEISTELNPLFRVFDVVARDELPRTASAKVMRRRLREDYP